VEAHGVTATAWTQGRDTTPALVDQPKLTEGSWVRDGGAVIEASFAAALGIGAGDRITLGGRSFRVAGVAVTAASTPYPKVCFAPCWFGAAADAAERNAANRPANGPVRSQAGPPPNAFRPGPTGLVWLTEADARSLVPQRVSLAYVVNLKLADPPGAQAFLRAHLPDGPGAAVVAWQDFLEGHSWLVETKQDALLVGSWLLSLLALASIAVLVGAGWPTSSDASDCSKRSAAHQASSPPCSSPSTSSWPSWRRRLGWRSDGCQLRCSPIPVPGWSAARVRCRSPCQRSGW
jgi:putative ABC transport system permease protein